MKTKYDLSTAKTAKKRHELKVQKSFRLDPEVLLWLEEQGEKTRNGLSDISQLVLKPTNV